LTLTSDLQSQESYGHDPYTCKRSVSSKDRVETDGQTDGSTDGGDCITPMLTRSVITNSDQFASFT